MRKVNYLVAALVIFFLGFIPGDSDIYFQMSRGIEIFGKVYKESTLRYVDPINPEEFMIAGIKGMLSSLDPYTIYIDENLQTDIDVITKGKYGGIGATVGIQDDKVTIVDLIEGYSAQRQGVRIGDVIIKVDSSDVTRENYEELGHLLRKAPGSEVVLIVKREGIEEELIFDLECEEIEIKNLTYYDFIPKESKNLYLKLSGFSRAAGEEIKKAIIESKKQREIKSIILDLRGNPGGLLDAAIDVCEKFLNKGQLIVSVMGRDTTNVNKYYSAEEPLAGNCKLMVLVDDGSASASEIVAGAFQDHDRGVILGEQSFGKGLVQTIIPLSYNTSLKITTAKYYTPSGRCIQKIDYSKKNNVFEQISSYDNTEYRTDNERKVLARGGIKPDTLVSNDSNSEQAKNMLARGMFFKFATKYYNENSNIELNDLSQDEVFSEFRKFLSSHDYSYVTKQEKLLEQLRKISNEQKYSDEFSINLENLEFELLRTKEIELNKYKEDILAEIIKELAARIAGRSGRVEQSLKYDKQFHTALSLLKNNSAFNQILNYSE